MSSVGWLNVIKKNISDVADVLTSDSNVSSLAFCAFILLGWYSQWSQKAQPVWKFGCGPDRAQTRSYRVLIWKSSQGQTYAETPIHLVARGNARSVTGLARLVTGLAPIIY